MRWRFLLFGSEKLADSCVRLWQSLLPLQVSGLLISLSFGLSACSGLSMSTLPSFGFGSGHEASAADCEEIEKRMGLVHQQYAKALKREKPSVYLAFSRNLSHIMRKKHLRGVRELTDVTLEQVVDTTAHRCYMDNHSRTVCLGARRLAKAYKPVILAAREAYKNYCGNRPIR